MNRIKYLILGGGISGLSFAYEKRDDNYLVLEKENEFGGLCRSFYAPGFVWDVAGHFFHFHSEETKEFVTKMLGDQKLSKVNKCAKIFYDGKYMDAPFQYNIHQLPTKEFIQCLTDLYYAKKTDTAVTFKDFVRESFGKALSDKFLIPYNEKLYACDLDELERDSMGKFLPKLSFDMLMSQYSGERGTTYNDFFLYPYDGCVKLVESFLNHLDSEKMHLNEEVLNIDTDKHIVTTNLREYEYDNLISTLPLSMFANLSHCGDISLLHSNKIVVLNLGFDKPSLDKEVNWAYYPGNEIFYRVGWYNNIAEREKLSLYVEIGCKADEEINIDEILEKTLIDLKQAQVIDNHKLEAYHSICVTPAYVHISKEGKAETERIIGNMKVKNTYMIGRYARWEYSAIDDSIEQAKELALQI